MCTILFINEAAIMRKSLQRFIDYRQLLKTNIFSKSDKTRSLTTTIKRTEQMKIILLIILFFIHYFLSIKTYKKYQGKKLLFLYLKWTVGACILAVLTSVMGNCFPTMDNRELYIMSTGTIIIISLSNLMILVLTTVFPYTLSLMKKLALKNGVQMPENYDEKINKKQTWLFNYLKIMQLVMCTVAILAIMFL